MSATSPIDVDEPEAAPPVAADDVDAQIQRIVEDWQSSEPLLKEHLTASITVTYSHLPMCVAPAEIDRTWCFVDLCAVAVQARSVSSARCLYGPEITPSSTSRLDLHFDVDPSHHPGDGHFRGFTHAVSCRVTPKKIPCCPAPWSCRPPACSRSRHPSCGRRGI
jgi:hypothetical protein